MAVLLRAPWGETIDLAAMRTDTRLQLKLFAWEHYLKGHRYYGTASQMSCECGESFCASTGLAG